MNATTARNHTLRSLVQLYDENNTEALCEWCEWNDPNGDYREDSGALWNIGEYWMVIQDAFDR